MNIYVVVLFHFDIGEGNVNKFNFIENILY